MVRQVKQGLELPGKLHDIRRKPLVFNGKVLLDFHIPVPSCAACTIGVDKVPSALGSGSDPNLCAANPEPSTLLVSAVRDDQVAGAVASS